MSLLLLLLLLLFNVVVVVVVVCMLKRKRRQTLLSRLFPYVYLEELLAQYETFYFLLLAFLVGT